MRGSSVVKNDLMPLLKLAVPMAITGLVQSSLYFFENIFLSRLGEDVLAAGALVSWLFGALIVILFGIFGAVSILISHKYGAKDKEGITSVLRDSFLLAILLVIPTFLLFRNISSIFLLFGQSKELVALAKLYLNALSWGLLPKFILIVLFEFLIGLGHSRTMMVVTLLTTPVYILFSFILIFGKFGFPALGIAGAGWGMTFADWMLSFILGIFLMYSREYKPYFSSIFVFKKPDYLLEIMHLGLPMGAMYSIEVAFFLAATLVMGTIGVQALAANQVTMQYLGPLMSIIFSIAQAVTVRMGHQLGAREFDLVKRTAITGVCVSACFMGFMAVIYWTIPQVLISVDFDLQNPSYAKTIQLAVGFFFIAAFFQIFECIRITLFGALRALKDTHFTLLTSILSFWGIALPLGYYLATYFRLGGNGIWYGMVVGAVLSVLLLKWRFKQRMHRFY
ncbi:MAG TPA: MATE family efflux transporter [Gammaproteobacteria bacterium]|jgi:MATE family multidrug resistance protein|nr:MATE family efflux transporter [Gammaproteobacteria bacterium]